MKMLDKYVCYPVKFLIKAETFKQLMLEMLDQSDTKL
jgi:hypothetical protein